MHMSAHESRDHLIFEFFKLVFRQINLESGKAKVWPPNFEINVDDRSQSLLVFLRPMFRGNKDVFIISS